MTGIAGFDVGFDVDVRCYLHLSVLVLGQRSQPCWLNPEDDWIYDAEDRGPMALEVGARGRCSWLAGMVIN